MITIILEKKQKKLIYYLFLKNNIMSSRIMSLKDYHIQNLIKKSKNSVFRIKNKSTNKQFALKKIKALNFEQYVDKLQEVLISSKFNHPNIISIFGHTIEQFQNSKSTEYHICILLEYMKDNFANEINNRRETSLNNYFNLNEAKKIIQQIIDVLFYLQSEMKIAHRDIKPENILIDDDLNLKLCDFSESFFQNDMKKITKSITGLQ